MSRMLIRPGLLLVALAIAAPASAQMVQGLHVGGGVFVPRSYDGRVAGAVLNEDLNSHPVSLGSTEIQQELKLRIVPVTGLVRFLPFGRPSTIQPYAGVGISALRFRYSESGEFIDFNDFSTFRTTYIATGVAVGPVFVAGVRIPIKGDIWGISAEWRYQAGAGDTGGTAAGFLSDKIDLGGNYANFGLLVRF